MSNSTSNKRQTRQMSTDNKDDDDTVVKRIKIIDNTVKEIEDNLEAYSYNGYNRNAVLGLISLILIIAKFG